jgi:hypothetical protein
MEPPSSVEQMGVVVGRSLADPCRLRDEERYAAVVKPF